MNYLIYRKTPYCAALSCRMPCYLEPQQLPPVVAQNQKCKQAIKSQCRNNAQIDGRDCLSVVSKKRLPGLRGRCPTPPHVYGDCRLGNLEPEHQQLAMDSGRAPQRISSAHPLDKITQAAIYLRPPHPILRFPMPEDFEAGAMPSQDGLRLNHLGRTKQARP